jgi:hypothetical protein
MKIREEDGMKKTNFLILALTSTLLLQIGITLEQKIGAQSSPLNCVMLENCTSQATCSMTGTANGCKLTCTDGAIVNCPKKGGSGVEPILD